MENGCFQIRLCFFRLVIACELHKVRKQLLSIDIMVRQIFRMELNRKNTGIVLRADCLNHAVIGLTIDLQFGCNILDSLMVHAVRFHFACAGNLLKQTVLFKMNGMNRFAIRRLLLMHGRCGIPFCDSIS